VPGVPRPGESSVPLAKITSMSVHEDFGAAAGTGTEPSSNPGIGSGPGGGPGWAAATGRGPLRRAAAAAATVASRTDTGSKEALFAQALIGVTPTYSHIQAWMV
jgi:hypothetical protein